MSKTPVKGEAAIERERLKALQKKMELLVYYERGKIRKEMRQIP